MQKNRLGSSEYPAALWSQKWNSHIWSAGWVTTALHARCMMSGDIWVCTVHCRIWAEKCIHTAQLEGQQPKRICKKQTFNKTAILQEWRLLQDLIYAVVQHSQKYSGFLVMLTKAVIILNPYQVCEKDGYFQQEPVHVAFKKLFYWPWKQNPQHKKPITIFHSIHLVGLEV